MASLPWNETSVATSQARSDVVDLATQREQARAVRSLLNRPKIAKIPRIVPGNLLMGSFWELRLPWKVIGNHSWAEYGCKS
jgi:hypothetical protein